MDNILSEKNFRLLCEPLYSSWQGPPPDEDGRPRPFAVLANVGLFASPNASGVAPDVMLSLDVHINPDLSQKRHRSYFVWEFGKPPDVVIEIVSNREGGELLGKRRVYRRMRVAYYVVYDPLKEIADTVLQAFELRGDLYVAMERPWFETVGLGLVEWDGVVEGTAGRWLRWCTRDGALVPSGAERAERERERAEKERERAESLAARLRDLGLDP